jgi:hypothetical protein
VTTDSATGGSLRAVLRNIFGGKATPAASNNSHNAFAHGCEQAIAALGLDKIPINIDPADRAQLYFEGMAMFIDRERINAKSGGTVTFTEGWYDRYLYWLERDQTIGIANEFPTEFGKFALNVFSANMNSVKNDRAVSNDQVLNDLVKLLGSQAMVQYGISSFNNQTGHYSKLCLALLRLVVSPGRTGTPEEGIQKRRALSACVHLMYEKIKGYDEGIARFAQRGLDLVGGVPLHPHLPRVLGFGPIAAYEAPNRMHNNQAWISYGGMAGTPDRLARILAGRCKDRSDLRELYIHQQNFMAMAGMVPDRVLGYELERVTGFMTGRFLALKGGTNPHEYAKLMA